jgi:NADH:ubiquinone oxidoreductase subunit 3 (subunit A)
MGITCALELELEVEGRVTNPLSPPSRTQVHSSVPYIFHPRLHNSHRCGSKFQPMEMCPPWGRSGKRKVLNGMSSPVISRETETYFEHFGCRRLTSVPDSITTNAQIIVSYALLSALCFCTVLGIPGTLNSEADSRACSSKSQFNCGSEMQKSGSELFWFGFYLVFCFVILAILASEPFPWQRYYHHLFTVALLHLILLLFCRVVYCLGTATSCVLVRSFSPSISAHAHKISVLFCYRGLFLYISQIFFQSSRVPVYIPGLNFLCFEAENLIPASSTLLPLNWKTVRTVPGFSLLAFTQHRATFNRWFMRVFSWL